MIGSVFLSEGVQKFVFPDQLGVGRFAKIGIPRPDVMGPFVGAVEIIAGLLVLFGFYVLWSAIALLIDISVALISTKLPILLGRPLWVFSLPKLPSYGWWSFLHEARTDWCMFLGCLALIISYARKNTAAG
jgi:putative oxidoreductase